MNKLILLTPFLLLMLMGIAGATTPTVPSSIQYYVPLNLTNSQTTATSAPFQQMVNITESSYSSYIAYSGSTANFEYFYSNGTIIPAWIESNSSGVLHTWVKTISIPASSHIQIYLGFASKTTNLLSSSGTSGIGEAPQLSSTYAEYDDGASVFNNYWNFAGTTLPSGWTSTTDFTGSVNNGLTVTSSSTWAGVASGAITASPPIILDAYDEVTSEQSVDIGFSSGTSFSSIYSYYDSYQYYQASSTSYTFADIQYGTSSSQTTIATGTLPIASNTGYNVYSAIFTSSSVAQLQNYASVDSASTTDLSSASYVFASVYNGATEKIQWLRTRAYPPSGVMPSVTFGSLIIAPPTLTISPNPSTYGQAITLTATCPLSTDSCAIDYPSLGTAIATGTGSATYTYNAFVLGAGTYSSYHANDITLGTNSIAQTLTVNQNSTYPFTLTSCGAQTYPYSCNTIGTISTYNNQLSANLYLNNVLLGSTTTTISNTITNQIGTYNYKFNTTGNTNYTSKSLTAQFLLYVPFYLNNVTAAGTVLTKTITNTYLSTPYTWNTYYPIKIYTQSPSNTLNYTLIQTLGTTTTTLVANALNISYIPSPNQATGNYIYQVIERQLANPQSFTFTIAANTLNMTDINSPFNFSTPIQYFPILAHTPVWTAKPSSWSIIVANEPISNQHTTNTSLGAQFDSPNLQVSFANAIKLNYPFTSFYLNLTDNPKVQTSLTLQPFKFVLANSIISSLRDVANFSIFSQYTFNGIPGVNATMKLLGTINAYSFNVIVSNNTDTNGYYYLQIPKSNYINPNVTLTVNASYFKSSPAYYTQTDLYCPLTASPGSAGMFYTGLVDSNGTKYTFYVSSASGSTLAGDLMQIIEQSGVHTVQVQSLSLPNTTPFVVPLEGAGESYAFDITNPPCTTYYYKGGLSVPSNPIYIFVNQLTGAYVYNVTQVFGACKITNFTQSSFPVLCVGGDPTSLTYKWKLQVYRVTSAIGTQVLVYNNTVLGSTLDLNFTLPKINTTTNTTNTYVYALFAYTDKSTDPVVGVNGGQLNFERILASASMWGFLALILGMVLIFVGVISGKPLIILGLINILLWVMGYFTPIVIPYYVIIASVILSAIGVYWVRKKG